MRVFEPAHPLANSDGYVLEHRKVMHDAGVNADGLHVHHINGDKADNRLENLEAKLPRDHHLEHMLEVGFVENQYGIWPLRNI